MHFAGCHWASQIALWSAAPSPALGYWPCPWSTYLNEGPPLVQAALDLVTVKQLGQATLGVVY